jgi:hypothetical protein
MTGFFGCNFLTPPDLKSELRQSGQFDYRGDFIPLRLVGLNGGLHSEIYGADVVRKSGRVCYRCGGSIPLPWLWLWLRLLST